MRMFSFSAVLSGTSLDTLKREPGREWGRERETEQNHTFSITPVLTFIYFANMTFKCVLRSRGYPSILHIWQFSVCQSSVCSAGALSRCLHSALPSLSLISHSLAHSLSLLCHIFHLLMRHDTSNLIGPGGNPSCTAAGHCKQDSDTDQQNTWQDYLCCISHGEILMRAVHF